MRRAALVLLGAFPVVPALPAGRAEHGLALLHELEADVHELDAQLGRSTGHHRHALGGLERRTSADKMKMTAANTAVAAFASAGEALRDALFALTPEQRKQFVNSDFGTKVYRVLRFATSVFGSLIQNTLKR